MMNLAETIIEAAKTSLISKYIESDKSLKDVKPSGFQWLLLQRAD